MGDLFGKDESQKVNHVVFSTPRFTHQTWAVLRFIEISQQRNYRVLVVVPTQKHPILQRTMNYLKQQGISHSTYFKREGDLSKNVIFTSLEKGINLLFTRYQRSKKQFRSVCIIGLDEVFIAKGRGSRVEIILFELLRSSKKFWWMALWTTPFLEKIKEFFSRFEGVTCKDAWDESVGVRIGNDTPEPFNTGGSFRTKVRGMISEGQVKVAFWRNKRGLYPSFLNKLTKNLIAQAVTETPPGGKATIVTPVAQNHFLPDIPVPVQIVHPTEDPEGLRDLVIVDFTQEFARKAVLAWLPRLFCYSSGKVILVCNEDWVGKIISKFDYSKPGPWLKEMTSLKPYEPNQTLHLTVLNLFRRARSRRILEEYVEGSLKVFAGFEKQQDFKKRLYQAFEELKTEKFLVGSGKYSTSSLGRLLASHNITFQEHTEIMKAVKKASEGVGRKGSPKDRDLTLVDSFATGYFRYAEKLRGERHEEPLSYPLVREIFRDMYYASESSMKHELDLKKKPKGLSGMDGVDPSLLKIISDSSIGNFLDEKFGRTTVSTVLEKLSKGTTKKRDWEEEYNSDRPKLSGQPEKTLAFLIQRILAYFSATVFTVGTEAFRSRLIRVTKLIEALDAPETTVRNYLHRIFDFQYPEDDLDWFGNHRDQVHRLRRLAKLEYRKLTRGRKSLVVVPLEDDVESNCGECHYYDVRFKQCGVLLRMTPGTIPIELQPRVFTVSKSQPACKMFMPRQRHFYRKDLERDDSSSLSLGESLCGYCQESLEKLPRMNAPVTCPSCGVQITLLGVGASNTQLRYRYDFQADSILKKLWTRFGLGIPPRISSIADENVHLFLDGRKKVRVDPDSCTISITYLGQTWEYHKSELGVVTVVNKPWVAKRLSEVEIPYKLLRRRRNGFHESLDPDLRVALQDGLAPDVLARFHAICLLTAVMVTTSKLPQLLKVPEEMVREALRKQGYWIRKVSQDGIDRESLQHLEMGVFLHFVRLIRNAVWKATTDFRVINPARGRRSSRRVEGPFQGSQDWYRAYTMYDSALNAVNHLVRIRLRSINASLGWGWDSLQLFSHVAKDKPGKAAHLDLEEQSRVITRVYVASAFQRRYLRSTHFETFQTPRGIPYYVPRPEGLARIRKIAFKDVLGGTAKVFLQGYWKTTSWEDAHWNYSKSLIEELIRVDSTLQPIRSNDTPATVPLVPETIWDLEDLQALLPDLELFWNAPLRFPNLDCVSSDVFAGSQGGLEEILA